MNNQCIFWQYANKLKWCLAKYTNLNYTTKHHTTHLKYYPMSPYNTPEVLPSVTIQHT